MDTSKIASLDFETCSEVDLRKVGAWVYANHPSTRVICGSYQLPGMNGPKNWRFNDVVPRDLRDWVNEGGKISAWNATFEWLIWTTVLPRQWPGLTIPELTIPQLIDTMAVAATNGLPLGLDVAAEALPHLNIQKDAEGRALMMRMNKPRKVHKDGTVDWWHKQDAGKLQRLMDYCDQDVVVERAILGTLWPMSTEERKLWEMDFEINARGVYLDRDLVSRMKTVAEAETARLDKNMNFFTGGVVPNTRAASKLLAHVQLFHPQVTSLAKDRIARLLADPGLNSSVRAVLEIRQEAAKTSVAKLSRMEACAGTDGRIRGSTQYYGAFRTGRWAGRLIQLQNFPRSEVRDQEGLVGFLKDGGDAEGIRIFFGVSGLTGVSSALRGCLSVPPGKSFAALDFAQIEARVLAWLAGHTKLLEAFENGRDIYRIAAGDVFGIRPEDVDGDQRQIGKVTILACGYGGGVGAFQTMAETYGVSVGDVRADEIKNQWRDENEEIVKLWYGYEDAAKKAVEKGGTWKMGRCVFGHRGGHLLVKLPSGRLLVYRDAEIRTGKFGTPALTYMGIDQYTRQWKREESYGGKLTENICQAVARDVMAGAMLRCHGLGFPILGSVHDEALFELDDPAHFSPLQKQFSWPPSWAQSLPIEADGYVGERFRKG